ncbi:PAS domain-containing protein [Pararhizobium arenae]|uniref:PAS domain-containing protein n=1 Tax=Pararhizobium arenae TaxID=1856850 RepID=UPI00094AE343|nr:PAS domain-containing protein [Pararhizobium arenae]
MNLAKAREVISTPSGRRALVVAIGAIGVVFTFVFSDPTGMLAPVAATCIIAKCRFALPTLFAISLATASFLYSPFYEGVDPTERFLGFFVGAASLAILLKLANAKTLFDRVYQTVQPNVEDIPGFGWSAYPDGRLRFLNPKALDYVGLTAEEMSELAKLDDHSWWSKFIHPDDLEGCFERWRHSMRTGEPIFEEQRVRRHDGTYRWLRDSAIASRDEHGNIVAWFATTVDINDQRRAEDALRKSERQLQQLTDTVPALIWCATPDGHPSYINARLQEWTGVSLASGDMHASKEFTKAILDAVHPDDRANWLNSLEEARILGRAFALRYRQRRHDGVYRWIDGKAEPLRDCDGNIIQWYGVCLDIHEQVEATEAMKRSEDELRLLIDTVPSLIWLMTPEGVPYYFNKRFVDWSGPSASIALLNGDQQTLNGFVHPDDRKAVEAAIKHTIAVGKPLSHRGRLLRKDGQYRWMQSRIEPLRDEHGNIVRWYGVNLDIDDEVRAQEALRRSDERLSRALRAASLSELSVSIAHELNQPLQALVANAHAFKRWLQAEPPNVERANRTAEWIVRDADAAAQVVSRIRALFGKAVFPRHKVDINILVRDVCDMLADKLFTQKVKVELDLDPELPTTSADRIQLEQVLMNLIRNAVEAMQDGASAPHLVNISTRVSRSNMIEVEVRDHGTGIVDPDKIFEPFFTTKQDGMGMGLAICHSIIEAHQGMLRAESLADGNGAALTFSLPIRPSEANDPGNLPIKANSEAA